MFNSHLRQLGSEQRLNIVVIIFEQRLNIVVIVTKQRLDIVVMTQQKENTKRRRNETFSQSLQIKYKSAIYKIKEIAKTFFSLL